ncbi:sigma-70 family RNA polymerase sigma factor [Rhodoblastus sp. 17X3]|uniref:sigma-70 family RNA polymerase sigma factor n=1 Tax=Rhodoblastus sp. 17X3 TaxID=3047026 RepID=UPI0024B7BBF1|nr:sigma-70 family RNA polymerase sigma factor [Rhodoblastus sp. 17X3]MDI9847835.1 sigma-70 family RNA polymerase sigma factor [Rhodoblastus sp. 17X3]
MAALSQPRSARLRRRRVRSLPGGDIMSRAMSDPQGEQRLQSKPVRQEFERLAEKHRRELSVHCYRMMGSLDEAEDLVQETYLRAWRSFDGFDGRGPFRAWLYRIATNACLDALAKCKHSARLMPDQRAPATTEMPDGKPAADVAWLDPYPDSELGRIADETPDPEARYSSRQAVQLAFVAAIQQLPPRQRAVLMLCDVIGWSAAEAATALGATTASINSALQRSRDTLAKRYPHGRPEAAAVPIAAQQDLLRRYMRAWEGLDVSEFVALLKEDATYTMPPLPQWYAGRRAIGVFFAWAWKLYDGFRMVPTAANGQPAFAAYSRAKPGEPWTAHSIHVLALEGDTISGLTLFAKPTGPRLFPAFGLPLSLEP